jgi:hypothetical protein
MRVAILSSTIEQALITKWLLDKCQTWQLTIANPIYLASPSKQRQASGLL